MGWRRHRTGIEEAAGSHFALAIISQIYLRKAGIPVRLYALSHRRGSRTPAALLLEERSNRRIAGASAMREALKLCGMFALAPDKGT
jgi:hypothetical protein